jgi:GntR family transcriptional regulator, transcriptional repressor for pyruvate dehydrogenase complex
VRHSAAAGPLSSIAGGTIRRVTTPVTDFPTIPRHSVTMDAATLIKDMILDGRLAPGHRLPSERTLSEALGVSRPSVREAIRSLVAMHILETRAGSGTYVSSLSLDELLRPLQFVVTLADSGMSDLFDVREMIEPGAAALTAERATDEEIELIHQGASESTAEGLSNDERAARDIEWHDLIVRCSHNGLLINVHQSIALLSVESRAITIRVPGVRERAVEDHRKIAKAICARKPEAARRAMHRHLESVRESLFAAVEAERKSGERAAPARGSRRR